MSTRRVFAKDPEGGSNTERAKWAATAIGAFRSETGTDKEDAVADLICDICHWCDRNKIDFNSQLHRGLDYYKFESHGAGKQLDGLEALDIRAV